MNDEHSELRPARPDVDGARPTYMPKLPWKWLVGAGLLLAAALGTCQVRERRETEALRAQVLNAYQSQLGEIATRYQTLLDQVFRLTLAVAQKRPERYVDPRLKLDVLGSGKGVYLRLPAKQAFTRESILHAGESAQEDAIARCLGLAPVWFPALYTHGTFLEKAFIQQAKDAESVLKLRVVHEELRQRTKRDLPFVAEAAGAQWFMLVLERGDNRHAQPVDAYIWDLRTNQLLFSGDAQAAGVLVSARNIVGGAARGPRPPESQSGAAHDCSIAAKLRAQAGAEAPVTFTSPAPGSRGDAQAPQATPDAPTPPP